MGWLCSFRVTVTGYFGAVPGSFLQQLSSPSSLTRCEVKAGTQSRAEPCEAPWCCHTARSRNFLAPFVSRLFLKCGTHTAQGRGVRTGRKYQHRNHQQFTACARRGTTLLPGSGEAVPALDLERVWLEPAVIADILCGFSTLFLQGSEQVRSQKSLSGPFAPAAAVLSISLP